MKKTLLLSVLLCTGFLHLFAQYNTNQNKVWAFGCKAGLDFTSGSPVPFTSAINTREGSASVCDAAGQLLFYTDGDTVYNRNHIEMPNGTHFASLGTASTTQASVIVPAIGNAGRYYIFSLEHREVDTGRLVYSMVDMSLDGGYGDVVASPKGVIVEDSLAEKMIAIAGSHNNIWLMVHLKDSAVFKAYEISLTGVNTTPVISRTGTFPYPNCYTTGVIKASPNGRKIVALAREAFGKGIELYDFDPATGVVSGCMVLDDITGYYGAEFSPDNTKLYVQEGSTYGSLYQYDVSLATEAAIKASKTEIVKTNPQLISDLKLAPDGKIYFHGGDTGPTYSSYLDCIGNPNLPGTACNYVYHAVTLLPGTGIFVGLPNLFVDVAAPATQIGAFSPTPTISLFPNPTNAQLSITSSTEIGHIKIFDITGRQVHNETINSKTATVDVSKLGEGIYLVNINSSFTRTFVKR